MKKVKAVRAWALVENNRINPHLCYPSLGAAVSERESRHEIIPVLITPIEKPVLLKSENPGGYIGEAWSNHEIDDTKKPAKKGAQKRARS